MYFYFGLLQNLLGNIGSGNYEGWFLHPYLGTRYDWMLFLMFGVLLLPLLLKLGVRFSRTTLTIIYTFCFTGASSATVAMFMLGPIFWIPYRFPDMLTQWPAFMVIPESVATAWYTPPGSPVNLAPWIGPMMYYFMIGLLPILATSLLAVIWRRQWLEVERLPYPYSRPIFETINEVTKPANETQIFKGPWILMWIGLLLGFAIYIPDVLYISSVGAIPRLPLGEMLWTGGAFRLDLTAQVGTGLCLSWTPFITAVLWFLPMDVTLTVWVAILVHYTIIPYILTSAGMWQDPSPGGAWGLWGPVNQNPPFPVPRMMWFSYFGVLGIGLWSLWRGRDLLRNIWNTLRGSGEYADDPVLSYRLAVPAYLICSVLWLVFMLASGGFVPGIITFWILWSVMLLGYNRIRGEYHWSGGMWDVHFGYDFIGIVVEAQGGFATIPGHMPMLFGSQQGSSVAFSGYNYKAIESFKVSTETKVNHKWVLHSNITAGVFGLLFAMFLWVTLGYNYGAQSLPLFGMQPVPNDVIQVINRHNNGAMAAVYNKLYPFGYAWESAVGGAVWTFLLMFLRSRFGWFPFNGVAWTVTGCMAMPGHLLPFLITWILQFIVWRVGGSELNSKATKIAMGFTVGWIITRILFLFVGVYAVGPANVPRM
jgi:hypothetical protein